MAEHVEGDWKTFRFRMVQPSDFPAILTHLRENFYRDEPLCCYSGYEDSMGDDFDAYVLEAMQQNPKLCFLVEEKESGKIAGVRVTTKASKDDHSDPPKFQNKKGQAIIDILIKLSEDVKIFDQYPNIDHYADFVMVSVDKEFRGHGLATEIYDRAFNLLVANKFPLIKCVFTSPYTQKIARKRGFKELGHINFRDWKNENGEMHYPMATEDEQAILMVKELNV